MVNPEACVREQQNAPKQLLIAYTCKIDLSSWDKYALNKLHYTNYAYYQAYIVLIELYGQVKEDTNQY